MSTVQKTMDAVITTGEYTDQQGNQKKRYMNIGTLFVYQDGGLSLKLDAFPATGGNISFYEKKPKQNNQGGGNQAPQQGHATGAGMNDPSSRQQSQYNQQQNPPAAQHLPNQNNNTQGNGYQQGQPVYDQDGQEIPI